jgi:hypothetical protein
MLRWGRQVPETPKVPPLQGAVAKRSTEVLGITASTFPCLLFSIVLKLDGGGRGEK